MDWGMSNRMSKLFGEDGNCFTWPWTTAIFRAPLTALRNPPKP